MSEINLLESATYRSAQLQKPQRVVEALKLVKAGASGDKLARAQLTEAITTSDFQHLLQVGIQDQVSTDMQTVEDETSQVARFFSTPSFERVTWRDLFLAAGAMRRVRETEEYKSRDPFADTLINVKTDKYGERYGFSYEMIKADRWNYLTQLPSLIVQDAIYTHNDYTFDELVGEDGQWSTDFFEEIGDKPLTYENVRSKRRELRKRRFTFGNFNRPADLSTMLLMVPTGQGDEARAIVSSGNLKEITNPNGRTRLERDTANELSGLTVVESETLFSKLDPAIVGSAWALLPGGNTRNPALVRTGLEGHPPVEVRVKNDTGQYVGGGDVPYLEGNYHNDTIDFRGRTTGGIATAFNYGHRVVDSNGLVTDQDEPLVFASTGTAVIEE